MKNTIIRRAVPGDLAAIDSLLYQVHAVHSALRPDLFISGAKKYTDDELLKIIADDSRPIFVSECGGAVLGYAFCIFKQTEATPSAVPIKTLYIDDLCVDSAARGRHIATGLYNFVLDFARRSGCHNLTLNVWEGNDGARKFYEHVGLGVQKTTMEKIL